MDDETILDALSAVQLARTYADRVYLVGHSLGAMLAPIIASRIQLDGIVMMAAPARDLADVVQEQLDTGKHVILNLETPRAAQIKRNMPEAVWLHVEPSDPEILRGIYEKNARSRFEVSVRMEAAKRHKYLFSACPPVRERSQLTVSAGWFPPWP